MAVDYSVFQTQYENFNKLLFQIQALRAYGDQYSVGQTADPQSFADALESAAGKVKVPESMDAIFEEAAQTYQVPVALLKAVGKVESDFNPKAVSSAGAQGVMQLMPGTAKELGVTDPFDARSNIMGGAKYLAQKLKKYNGDIDLTLAAYNAGSGTVAKYGGVPSFTRKYIEKVKSYMGQNLTTGKTVNTQTCSQTTSAARAYSQPVQTSGIQTSSASTVAQLETVSNILEQVKNGYTDYGQEDARYHTQMMKLQMQNQAIGALGRLLSDDEEEKGALFTL